MKLLQRRVEARRAELALLEQEQEEQETSWRQYLEDLIQRRTVTNPGSGGSDGE